MATRDLIPRNEVIQALAMTNAFWVTAMVVEMSSTRRLRVRLADAEQRFEIMKESTLFLIDRADDKTMFELDQKMDFWRVIRGLPKDKDPETPTE